MRSSWETLPEDIPETENEETTDKHNNTSKSDIKVVDLGEGLFNILISEAAERELWKPWWRSLIVKLLGRKIGYAAMKRRLETIWGRFGGIDVIDLGNDFYIVKFLAQDDLDHALLDGPWKIYDHYLAIRLWEPNFNPLLTTIDKITAWVRLPGLPIELYNDQILRKIGDLIGKTCKVDYNTSHLCRGKFARLCVEVDLTKPLLGRYMVNGKLYNIEYEGIHQICFTCGKVDHDQKNCAMGKERVEQSNDKQDANKDQAGNEAYNQAQTGNNNQTKQDDKEETSRKDKGKAIMNQSNDNFGPWMVVQRQRRGKKESKEEGTKNGAGTSKTTEKKRDISRFSVLEIEEPQQGTEEPQANNEAENTHQNNNTSQHHMTKAKPQLEQQTEAIRGSKSKNTSSQAKQYTRKNLVTRNQKNIQPEVETKDIPRSRQEAACKENWIEANDDTQDQEEQHAEKETNTQQNMEEDKPPDPTHLSESRREDMELEIQKEISKLVEGVDFETPPSKGWKDEESADMQLN
ncbi:uncharacterized protein DS421_11g342530 [Arachis hypogaea]|nr:uncharacterized protein DS421_11g342530 [Arachis hypogaea]